MNIHGSLRWLVFTLPWLAIAWFIVTMDLSALKEIKSYYLAVPILMLIVLNWWVQAIQSRLLIKVLGYPISATKAFQLLLASIFLNYLPMKPGTVFRGYILKRDHNVSWSDYGAVTLFRSAMLVGISALIAFYGLKDWSINLSTSHSIILVITLLIIGLSLLHPTPQRAAKRVTQGFILLSSSPNTIISLCLLISIQMVLLIIRLKLSFDMLGITVSYHALLVGAASASVLLLTPFTPGGIGVREFGVAGILATLSIPFESAAAALILDRLFLILTALILGGGAYRILLKKRYSGVVKGKKGTLPFNRSSLVKGALRGCRKKHV